MVLSDSQKNVIFILLNCNLVEFPNQKCMHSTEGTSHRLRLPVVNLNLNWSNL
jgi:hypothetical protein